ncbi:DUF4365 domain-containing protein [Sinimarinibacterium sp. CAU 1509]|uniref:DUF4365 domain-containing protein n=1 Tax=Sinimarinibacterium sp. CAU 1509 TaxID=2562283 RepID=UPI0010AD8261|nr:DUF4365 domain-containing protein [Sinimarinibacterium sp. CAU 1509]TJY58210.1 DUF4365 domain-containing protein [Sinimarinibacterium sp. CAU 1509]
MAKNRAKIIGDLGETLVQGLLQAYEWEPRKDVPDEGYDFNVEIPARGKHPSERFFVQVKTAGVRRPLADGSWAQQLKLKDVRRYDASRHPVFLFAVDLKTETIRALDYHHEATKQPGALTFRFAEQSQLDPEHCSVLECAVRLASRARDAKYASPVSILKLRSDDLAALDHRFNVTGEVVAGVERYRVEVKPKHAVTFHFRPKKVHEDTFRKVIKYGGSTTVDIENFYVPDSELFRNIALDQATLRVENQEKPVRIRFAAEQSNSFLDVDATVTFGIAGSRVQIAHPRLPYHFEFIVEDDTTSLDFNWTFNAACWVGQPILQLSYFSPLFAFSAGLARGEDFGIYVEVDGVFTTFARAPSNENITSAGRWMNELLSVLTNLREVCTKVAPGWRFPENFSYSESDKEEWAASAALLRGALVTQPIVTVTADIELSPEYQSVIPDELFREATWRLACEWGVSVGNECLGVFEVYQYLVGYTASQPLPGKLRLTPSDGARHEVALRTRSVEKTADVFIAFESI